MNDRSLKYTLADAVHHWIVLSTNVQHQETKQMIERAMLEVCKPLALTANFFHHIYKGSMDDRFSNTVFHAALENVDENGMDSYLHYEKNTDIFKLLSDKEFKTADIFWRCAEKKHKQLSEFALKLLHIPACTSKTTIGSFKFSTSDDDINKKSLELYYSLKLNG